MLRAQDTIFINNQFFKSASGQTIATVNPSTEDVIAHIASANEHDVNRAVAAARHAFDNGPWSKVSVTLV
jgi:aldehyde dehydrogenase (NAD+)